MEKKSVMDRKMVGGSKGIPELVGIGIVLLAVGVMLGGLLLLH